MTIPGMTHGMMSAAAAVTPVIRIYTDSVGSASNATTYTFNSRSIGTAFTGRRIFFCCCAQDNASGILINSATVNGSSATEIIESNVGTGSNSSALAWYRYDLDTGTTANFSFTCNQGATRAALHIFNAQHWNTTTPVYSSDKDEGGTSAFDMVVNIPAGGAVLVVHSNYIAASVTWGNLVGTDQDADFAAPSNEGRYWVTSKEYASASTSQELSGDITSGTVTVPNAVAIVVGPN